MKRGALWAFAKAPQFKLVQGEDALTDYQFGKKKIHHLFCNTCGIGSFSRGLAPNGEETFADQRQLPRRRRHSDAQADAVRRQEACRSKTMARVTMIPPETTEPEARDGL